MVQYNIVCVGCGGTGSFFIKEFARFMSAFKRMDENIALAVVDGDRIEEKNLQRQSFLNEDINSFKALTMAQAVKENFKVNEIYAYPIYLDQYEQLNKIFSTLYSAYNEAQNRYRTVKHIDVLIGTVDNHRARQVMEQFFKKSGTIFYFDAANEFSNGEVVFGGKYKGEVIGQTRAFYFPGIMKDRSKRASEKSCGVINKEQPQHIVTNMMAANILLGKTIPLITDGKVDLGISYFDAFAPFSAFYPYEKRGDEVVDGEKGATTSRHRGSKNKDKATG